MQVLNRQKTFFSISFIVILVIALHYLGWLNPVENFLRVIIKPGSRLMYNLSVKINNNNENFNSLDDLRNAYQRVKEENLNNKIDLSKISLLEQENVELRSQLNYLNKKTFNYLGAEVIGKNIDPLESTLVLNRGVSDGVKVGQPVITGRGALIGQIVKAEKNESVVRLINDNQSRLAAIVINQDKSTGMVEGGYGISIRMKLIPQNESVNVGEMIATSGLQPEIPRGLFLGTVQAVEKQTFQPFQEAILTPLEDLNKLTLVNIITFNQ